MPAAKNSEPVIKMVPFLGVDLLAVESADSGFLAINELLQCLESSADNAAGLAARGE